MAGNQLDVLVVGGGPAGSSAAKAAAAAGAEVLLIEAKGRIGARPHCAEYVPRLLALEIDFPPRSAAWPIEAMETRLPEWTVTTSAPGYILDRDRFDHGLAEAAAAAGAEIQVGTRLVRADEKALVVRGPKGEKTLRPKIVVAADGAVSRLRRLSNRPRPALLTGVQMEVPLSREQSRTLIFFDQRRRFGYAWLFPKGQAANLGLGLRETRPGQAWAELEELADSLEKEGLIRAGCLSRSVGAIVVSGAQDPLVQEGPLYAPVIFTGDAAGLTHPITGAGIPQAVFSGQAAGRAAAGFVRSGDHGSLTAYEAEVKGRYQRTLTWALQKRALLEKSWDDGDFSAAIARAWPAFREYRSRD